MVQHLTLGNARYVADNTGARVFVGRTGNSYRGGFGGILMSRRVEAIMLILGRRMRAAVAISALSAEGRRGPYIAPGHVTETFSKGSVKTFTNRYRLQTGQINPRKAVKISYTGRTQKPITIGDKRYVRTDPVVLEAGSKYNEKTPQNQPALGVLSGALKVFAARYSGTRIRITNKGGGLYRGV